MPDVLGYLLLVAGVIVLALTISGVMSDALGMCAWCGRLDYDTERCRHCPKKKPVR